MVANNPSVCAVAQVLRWTDRKLDDVVLLSLGTGLNPRAITGSVDWGWGQWALELKLARPHYDLPIIQLMLEGSVDLARYQCQQLLGERFLRLDPKLPRPVEIDAVYETELLEQVADDTDLGAAGDWVDRVFPEVRVAAGV